MKTTDKLSFTVAYIILIILILIIANDAIGQSGNIFSEEKEYPTCPEMFSAGPDASICNDDYFITEGFNRTPVMSMWQSSGDGIFENSNNPNTIYIPGEQDIMNGSVTLTLILFPMGGGGSDPIQDSMILHLNNCEAFNQF